MRTQIRYQKEIEKLENQNRELRKQLLLKESPSSRQNSRKIKKSLIDMYSEVLDELSGTNFHNFFWQYIKFIFATPFILYTRLYNFDII